MPTKQRYRVLIPSGIEYPTDPNIIKEIEAGGNPGFDRRGNKHVRAGRMVDDIPETSIPILLRKKWIEKVEDPPPHGDVAGAASEGGHTPARHHTPADGSE